MRKHGIFGTLALTVALSACGTNGTQSPNLGSTVSPEYVEGELLVQLNAGLSAQSVTSLETQLGVQMVERLATTDGSPLYLARITNGRSVDQAIQAISANSSVRFAEKNWIYQHTATSSDPYFTNGNLWGTYGDESSPANQYGSQAAEAWAAGHTGSKNIVIGVIDEGIQYTHPDLSGQVGNPGELPFGANGRDDDGNGYVDDLYGWDFDGNDNTVYDGGTRGSLDDHGTHVAGTIGAKANSEGIAGVNWNVTMISGKFLGRRGGTTANAVKAVDYFTDLKTKSGLNVVATNNSWGGGGYSQALYDAIERANRAGILFIAAAGNGGSDGVGDDNDKTPHYPSSYTNANIIAVAAITSSGAKSTFSNYGKTSVDIGAPGSGIWSTTAYNTYSSYNGTSMATPHVTGAAALYASVHPSASASQIRDALVSKDVDTNSLSLTGPTPVASSGRLNVAKALGLDPLQ